MFNINTFLPYGVATLKAILLLIIGWIVATLSRSLIKKGLSKIAALQNQEAFIKSAGNLVYYLVLLITLVGVLELLGLKYVTQPFLDFLNRITAYLPNIIGALVILVIGVLFAKIAKEFITSLAETFKIKEFGKKYNLENIGNAAGNIVYLIILIFVIIAALNALEIQAITQPAVLMLSVILKAIPKIIAAGVVFIIAYYIGKILSDIGAKVVEDLNLNKIAENAGLSSDKVSLSSLVKYLILTFAILLGLAQAFNYLEARALYQLVYQFILIAFKITVASIILVIGMYLGNIFDKRVENRIFGKVIKISFLLAAVFIALPYIGVSPRIVEIVVFSISIGIGVAFAIAFGLGGRKIAEDLLKKFFEKNEDKEA